MPDMPGVMAYGTTRPDAVAKAEAQARRIIADRIDHGAAIGPKMLARISKHTGLAPRDLSSSAGSCIDSRFC